MLAAALRTLAARWGRLTAEDDAGPGGTRLAIAAALGALVQLLLVWSTPQGERLRRLAFELGSAALPPETPPASAVAPSPKPSPEAPPDAAKGIAPKLGALLEDVDGYVRELRHAFVDAQETAEDMDRPEPSYSNHVATLRKIGAEFHTNLRAMERDLDTIRRVYARPILVALMDGDPAIPSSVMIHGLTGYQGEAEHRFVAVQFSRDPAALAVRLREALAREFVTIPPKTSTAPCSSPSTLTAADVGDLREQLADLAGVALDATTRPGLRRLGRFTARRTAIAAHRKASQILSTAGEARP